MQKLVFHIATKEDWQKAQAEGVYIHSSLESEGFIHFSTKEQVIHTANRFFNGVQGLLLLQVDSEKLTSQLKYEFVENMNQDFPHLFGPLNIDATSAVYDFVPDADGTFDWPSDD